MKGYGVLVVCREVDHASLLAQVRPVAGFRYVVASDDPRVREEARRYSWVSECCWIEQMESLYCVAADVTTIQEAVNRWLQSLAGDDRNLPANLLFWQRHVEGGMTSQRVQDVLLLLRSYSHLFDAHTVEQVIILRGFDGIWDDEVLKVAARARGIGIQEVRVPVQSLRLGAIKRSLRAHLRPLLRELHNSFHVVRAMLRARAGTTVCSDGTPEIVFQLHSSEYRHAENIISIMKALQEEGYRPIALCWQADGGAELVRKEGLTVEYLERWVPVSALWEAVHHAFRLWRAARKGIHRLHKDPALRYRSVPIGQLLSPSMHYFFMAEIPSRFRLDRAIKRYLGCHRPVAMRLWGAGALAEGRIALNNLPQQNKPLIFFNSVGPVTDSPYAPENDPTDLFLVAGDHDRAVLERTQGVEARKISVIGRGRHDRLSSFREIWSPAQSRSCLGLPSGYEVYALFDSNAVLRGYLTAHEQACVTTTLLRLSEEISTFALVIKPHPTHQPGSLEQLLSSYSLPNVFVVDRSMLPYHALNAVDIVVTKASTIGIEAMLFNKPVISAVMDGDDHWASVYGGAAALVKSPEALNVLMRRFAQSKEFRSSWTHAQLEKQAAFLRKYHSHVSRPSAKVAAEAMASAVRRRIDGSAWDSVV